MSSDEHSSPWPAPEVLAGVADAVKFRPEFAPFSQADVDLYRRFTRADHRTHWKRPTESLPACGADPALETTAETGRLTCWICAELSVRQSLGRV
jgi:hypothetical protein